MSVSRQGNQEICVTEKVLSYVYFVGAGLIPVCINVYSPVGMEVSRYGNNMPMTEVNSCGARQIPYRHS
jgi:hypothetical protein